MSRYAPDVNGERGSNRNLNATPMPVLVSSQPALTQVRAWRDEPLRSTSTRWPFLVILTFSRNASSSAMPSASNSSSAS
jgi:hypothetical protein